MPSRDGLYSSPRVSGKPNSYIDSDHDIHHPQRGVTDNSFTSALAPSPLRPTALRRRGSDGDSSWGNSMQSHHSRSRTTDNTSDPHPLRRSSTTKSARHDVGSTRPRLSRALTPTPPVLARPDPPADRAGSHRTVLVHEVSPNDSLAGVALKYGISVTELRRANQLWASDSIHLRHVLYIPLDKARHASLETVASLLAQRDDGKEEDTAHPHSHSRSRSDPDADPRSSDRPSVVRRIPSTSLSFFPPPSSAPSGELSRPASSPSHVPPPAATSSTLSKGSTLTSTLRATALSSLFSVLPINASTRDEIFSRLSIDSVSNSTTASDDAEHELTAVLTTPKRKPLRIDDDASTATLTNSRRKSRARHAWLSETRNNAEAEEPHTRDVEQIALASSPIHTTQMQPAATMQLPGSMMRSSAPRPGMPLSQDSLNGAWRPSRDHHPQMR
ncbi:hypothetical protein EDB85DRAFT_194983 [Lactarius pseudohatsudake]|nr:hypothetical protein EDB85DRAFT_194983 [Lactarius pseudohatsudake]